MVSSIQLVQVQSDTIFVPVYDNLIIIRRCRKAKLLLINIKNKNHLLKKRKFNLRRMEFDYKYSYIVYTQLFCYIALQADPPCCTVR